MQKHLNPMHFSRQIPLETVVMSNSDNSWIDPILKNRIHFRFPDSWTNAIGTFPIVGIRDIFITKSFRHAVMKLKYSLSNDDGVVKTGFIHIEKFFDDETLLKDLVNTLNEKLHSIAFSDEFVEVEGGWTSEQLDVISNTNFITSYFEYVEDPVDKNIHYNRFVIESPFNNLPEATRTKSSSLLISSSEYHMTFEFIDPTVNTTEYTNNDFNSDAQVLLNYTSELIRESSEPMYFNKVWDRKSCVINSNISSKTDSSYLGHARQTSLPMIKYYDITSSNKSFWVELYATCDHKAPVYLPSDGKDELYIELQLLTNATPVL